MTYARETIPSVTLREHGGEIRGIPPRAPKHERTVKDETVGYAEGFAAKLEAGKELANQRVRQVSSTGMTIVEPHRNISRDCTDADVRQIVMSAFLMRDLFGKNTIALAHPQVANLDPLRFFVLAELLFPEARSTVIVNPRITRHVNYEVDSVEGCHTFASLEHIPHKRWRLIEVEYQTCEPGSDTLSPVIHDKLKGLPAFVFQHELDHLNAIYCYD